MSEGEAEGPHVLEVGDEAVVSLLDGTQVKGKVISLSPSFVVLGSIGNFGYDETKIESHTIESIAWVNSGSIWPFLAVVVVSAVVWSADQLSKID